MIHKKINHAIGRALATYNLINKNDKILVAVSGGKDSLVLLKQLLIFQKKSKDPFDLLAVNLDQGLPDFDDKYLPKLFKKWEVPFHIEKRDTYKIVTEKIRDGKNGCALCSRLRRGILYDVAQNMGCNKIALGHHREDVINTFLLNIFFSGKISTMIPIYESVKNITVIRPLVNVEEQWIKEYIAMEGIIPMIPPVCAVDKNLKRKEIADLLDNLSIKYPEIKNSIYASLGNPSTNLLYDTKLWQTNKKY